MIRRLNNVAREKAQMAQDDYKDVFVSELNSFGEETDTVSYFEISAGEDNAYVIYQILDEIYYRPAEEFYNIQKDFENEVPGQAVEALKVNYLDDTPIDAVNVLNSDDCMFILSAIFSSLTGDSYDIVNENVKIKRNTSLSADNDPEQSKKIQDIKYGSKDKKDFEQEIEDKQKADGTIGALDQKQEESTKPKLPNANLLKESQEFEYEVEDKVILDGDIWHVFGIIDNLDAGQILRITREGQTRTIPANKVKPEPNQYERFIIDNFDLNDKTRLNNTPKNEEPVKMEDLNEQSISCNIRFDNAILERTITGEKFRANVKDILEEADPVRVYIGDDIQEVPKQDVFIDTEDWPYAVVVGTDDEPVRKIKIDPMAYIDAKEEDDLVRCMIGDKETVLPKRVIKILS